MSGKLEKIKAFFERLFWGENLLNASNKEEATQILQREPTPDELVLGWAEGTDETTKQTTILPKGVSQEHRSTHFYVVGASGSGKTKFLETLAEQDIKNGHGFGVIDAHGDLTEDLKGYLYLLKKDEPEFLRERVVLIDPTDPASTTCFNPLEKTEGITPAGIASELVEVFKKIWKDSWGARMEDLLKNTLIALIENNLTLAELPLFLTDFNFRKFVLEKVEHPICRQYFERYNTLAPHTRNEWIESTLNKVNAFLSDDNVRQMFVSPKSTFNLRDVMDNQKVLLVKLDRGHLKGNADLLGALLLAKIQMAAFSRTDIPASKRVPFYLYIDEFQNFATESFTEILAEARKYKLSLILAHQNLAQLSAQLRASLLSNCGLQAYFRISREDANILAKESLASIYGDPPGWEFYIQHLQELPRQCCVVKNKIEGGVVFITAAVLRPPYEKAGMDEEVFRAKVAAAKIGGLYLRPREDVEEEYKAHRRELLRSAEQESFRERK